MSHLQEQNNEHSSQDSIDKTYAFPASYAQQRLWFLDRLLGASGAFNIHWAVMLEGTLDITALRQSFNEIVARHEVLRTYFTNQNGEPTQMILPFFSLECPVTELSSGSEKAREQEAQQIIDSECDKTFDLEQVPLLRTLVIKLAEQKHILLVIIHHIVSDGWSMNVFRQELESLYRAFSQGLPSPLPDLPIQYRDYVVWQRSRLQGVVLEQQLSYWKKQLKDLTVLELPTDRPRPSKQSFRGAREQIKLSEALTQSMKTLSQREGVTLFMTLLAAFQVLLYRYSGQDDIAIGTAISGRKQHEIDNLIGFFVNTLVLRNDLSGNPTFKKLLQRVHKVCVDAYRTPIHRDMPFDKLVAELKPQKDLSRHPLFQVALVLRPTSLKEMQLPGLSIEEVTINNKTAQFDLMLSLKENQNCLAGYIEYSTDLFDASTITRMAGHFQTLLEAIVEHPETAIAELPLVTTRERHQLLVEWNATQTDYPKAKCIHQLFEEQVAKTPDAIALVFEDQQLSYRVLNEKANQLAHYLASLNIGPEKLVGICLERSLFMLVAVLGILKAGGGYLPLDPTYPKARLKFMLADAQAPVLLTHTGQIEKFPETNSLIIYVDELDDTLSTFSAHNPSYITKPENLAYILYTSGSTGTPKGVAMHHRALINLLHWQTDGLKQTQFRRTLQFTSINFDVSFQEIFTALVTGGCLVLISEEQRRDPKLLLKTLVKQKVTDLYLPFIALQQLAHSTTSACEKNHLKVIITAGEQLNITPAIKQFIKNTVGCRLINQYGPTECHVVTSFNLPENITDWAEFPSIGRPIDNTEIYILDRSRQPAPIGVAGEIYIGGNGLARGYYNRPELTVEKFIKHPFSDNPQARLYKTGDLARYLPNGTIEFLGRIDHQVKIRGFRIELGEIESVLGQHAGINEVVVTVREDQPGDKRLVAYLADPQHEPPNVSALRLFLKEKLPEYMVPSAFVLLDKLPLTPNGKIDRKALPAPEQTREEFEQAYVSPRSPVEEMLAAIWGEILNIDQIGIHDNFFQLGGHSLLAMKLIVRINKQFQIDFPLYLLFEEPTVAGLSVSLESLLKQVNPIARAPIKALARKGSHIK
jgi:amino acid adenylation domain-containing protein